MHLSPLQLESSNNWVIRLIKSFETMVKSSAVRGNNTVTLDEATMPLRMRQALKAKDNMILQPSAPSVGPLQAPPKTLVECGLEAPGRAKLPHYSMAEKRASV